MDKPTGNEPLPYPEGLYFHREHTWIRVEDHPAGKRMRIGLDDIFLQDIGEINVLDLPNEGDEISQDEVCGVIRGKQTKKELYAPVSGEILDVNLELHEDPDIIREDPYGIGWLLLVDPSEPEEEMSYLLSGKEALRWWKNELKLRALKKNST